MQGPHVFNHTITYPGRQKVGDIMKELEREAKEKRDLVVNSKHLRMQVVDGQLLLRVPNPKSKDTFLLPIPSRVHCQIAQWMHVRMGDGFYKWLIGGAFAPKGDSDSKERRRNWDIMCDVFNSFTKRQAERRLIRMLYNRKKTLYARAFLSDRYQIIDSSDFFFTIVGALQKMGAEVWHARLSDDKFYGYAVHPKSSAIIDLNKAGKGAGDHTFRRFAKDGKDEVHPAMVFGNSETGEGGCFMQQALLWTYCINYAITTKVLNKTHVGRRRGEEMLLKAETIKKENEVFFLKTADIVESTFDEERFKTYIKKLEGAHEEEVTDPEKAAQALQVCYDVSEDMKSKIRNTFLLKYPQTRYGLIGAVTEVGHADDLNPDEGVNLEELGARLIDTKVSDLVARADKELKRREAAKPEKVLATAEMDI
jgi:hypothetical protein